VAACTSLTDSFVTEQSIRQGLKSAFWPGRLEVCGTNPSLLLDGAHNIDSFKKLTAFLSELFPHKRKIWVFGIMKDKPLTEITELISDYADYIIATQPKSDRSISPEEIRKAFKNSTKPIDLVDKTPLALGRAYQVANPEDVIVVTGSLFTVAEAKQVIDNQTHNS
jgi:dihydrofolate synthase/folylpolyglutamate synthase